MTVFFIFHEILGQKDELLLRLVVAEFGSPNIILGVNIFEILKSEDDYIST